MVLPAPAADPGAAEARAWLDKLIQPLELSRGGILLCLRDATPTQLGPVVRALSSAPPWADAGDVLEVCLRAPDVLDVAPGSRVLLRVRVEDLDWLNIARPLFAERELRTILWADALAFDGLIRRAVDFFDWVSRVVAVPSKAVPDFAVSRMREALAFGAEIAWMGPGLHETLCAAGGGSTIDVHVEEPYLEIIEKLRTSKLPIVTGVGSERDAWRIRMALALAEAGSWVALDPGVEIAGMRLVHAQQFDWDDASAKLQAAGWRRPALLAAWLDLEPERIAAAAEHVEVAQEQAPEPTFDHPGDSKEERLLRAVRGMESDSPSTELITETLQAGFPEVAMSLSLVRWKLEEDEQADSLVGWLIDEAELETAREVVQDWRERASAGNDSTSLDAADHWSRLLEAIGDVEPHTERGAEIPRNGESDDELLERWVHGDRDVASTLFERYYDSLHRYFRTKVLDNTAPDLVQETFLQLVQSISRFSRLSSFRSYLFGIAHSILLKHIYGDRRRASLADQFTNALNPELEIEQRELRSTLLACLQTLPLTTRSLLELRYWEGLSSQELAEVFGVSSAAIRARLVRARQQLVACMGTTDLDSELPR